MSRQLLSLLTLVIVACFASASWAEEVDMARPRPRPIPGRPHPRPRPPSKPRGTLLIGHISSSNPLTWDTDSVTNNSGGFWTGVVLELDRGVDTDISDIEVTCRDGRVCYRDRVNQTVYRGGNAWMEFPMDIDVAKVSIRFRPNGVSIPSTRLNVYLYR